MISSCHDLRAGDIFSWDNYPLFNTVLKDRRWFLFLGHRKLEAIIYQITTTTQFGHYQSNGSRIKNNFFKINAGIGCLIEDSIIDLTTYFERVPEKIIEDYKSDIDKHRTRFMGIV